MIKIRIAFFLLIISTPQVFGQINKFSNEDNQIKVYQFVLQNLDSIKKHSNVENISMMISYKKNYEIEKISYHSARLAPVKVDTGAEISIWYSLDNYIREIYKFCPNDVFRSKNVSKWSYFYVIPLSKENLIKGIKFLKKDQKVKNVAQNVSFNSKFSMIVDTLYFNKVNYSRFEISSRLDILNSEIIEIEPNVYFAFRIIKTSGNDFFYTKKVPKDFVEYKLFYYQRGSLKLVLCDRQSISNKSVTITQIENSSSDDPLLDCNSCNSEDSLYLLNDLKLNLKIIFR